MRNSGDNGGERANTQQQQSFLTQQKLWIALLHKMSLRFTLREKNLTEMVIQCSDLENIQIHNYLEGCSLLYTTELSV